MFQSSNSALVFPPVVELPPLPPRTPSSLSPMFSKHSYEEIDNARDTIINKYMKAAQDYPSNFPYPLLRSLSGSYDLYQNIDWSNMYLSDLRTIRSASRDTLDHILEEKAAFAIYYHLISPTYIMHTRTFNSYAIAICNAIPDPSYEPITGLSKL